jgi:hypothetical protein
MSKPDWTDAKFDIVTPPPEKRRWRSPVIIDWRNFLIVGGLTFAAALARMLGMH